MFLELLALAIIGLIVYNVSMKLIHRDNWSVSKLIPHFVWLLLAIWLLVLWPEALEPTFYPFQSLLFFTTIAVYPLTLVDERSPHSRLRKLVRLYGKSFMVVGITTALLLTIRYLAATRPRIEGVDFYYYVCVARDLAGGFGVSASHYFYFPGVFSFWRIPLELGLTKLSSLQWIYVGVIAANAAFIALIVWRSVRSFPAAVFSACWYVSLCSKFEGYLGTTEPIATLPALLGIFFWGGKPILKNSGTARAIALGAGLGLALYVRQFAGLISLGVIAVVISEIAAGRMSLPKSIRFGGVALTAAVVLLTGILLEGHGFEPIRISFSGMQRYGMENDFWYYLSFRVLADPLFAILSALALAGWLSILILPRLRSSAADPWAEIIAFTVGAGCASLIQFKTRIHGHYALLAVPMFELAIVILFVKIVQALPPAAKKSSLLYLAVILFALFPFVRIPAGRSLYLWPVDDLVRGANPYPGWWANPQVSQDLKVLSSQVKRGEDIFVLPPQRNEIHFFLGTRSVSGSLSYGWGTALPLDKVLQSPTLNGIIFVNREFLDPTDIKTGSQFDYEIAPEILNQHGFKPVSQLRSMVLWRRRQQ